MGADDGCLSLIFIVFCQCFLQGLVESLCSNWAEKFDYWLFKMKTPLKLMLLKDFRTLIRNRWFIIAIEAVLILLFIPVIWYAFAGTDKVSDAVSNQRTLQDINGFINGTTREIYRSRYIYVLNHNFDLSPMAPIVKSSCLVDMITITPETLSNHSNFYESQYMDIKHFDPVNKILDYENVKIVYDVDDGSFKKRFSPNTYGGNLDGSYGLIDYDLFPLHCMNMAFLTYTQSFKIIPKNISAVNFVSIPSPLFDNDNIATMFDVWAVVLPALMIIPAVFSIKEIAREKENGIHTYMIVMGMKRLTYYLSHFIFATVKMWAFAIPAGLAIVVFVPNTWFYYINLILMGHVIVAWAMFSTTVFISGTYAMLFTFSIFGGFVAVHHAAVAPNAPIEVPGTGMIGAFFNPYTAYMFSHDHCSLALNYDGVGIRFFDGWPYYLPAIVPFIFLIMHVIFYTFLTFYLDYVLPIDSSPKSHPLFIFGLGEKEEKLHAADIEGIDQVKGRFSQFFEHEMTGMTSDVDIKNLIKKWPNGELAVKDVSFRAYRGQVTALLGHNGAGKSTIFGCLTGFLSPTSGDVKIGDGKERIGYCPQWDPLFPLLTVEEHLKFYGTLKTGTTVSEMEIDHVLQQVDLVYARAYRGMALSGGMKRKLCVGMAMIGQSRVLLLDEPTAGMDPIARKGVLDIVEQIKKDKTIILTTHYMDEADMLSDRIIIMAKGELICNGSSNFLKSKFGVGFVLTVAFEAFDGSMHIFEKLAENIIGIAQNHCPGSKLDGVVANQFKIVLPNGMQRQFADMFAELENRKEELKINSFGIGVNNLEQVFIKVTDFADPEADSHTEENVNEFLKLRTKRSSGGPLLLQQIKALCIRKLHYVRRHYVKSLLPLLIILPLIGMSVTAAIKNTNSAHRSSDYHKDLALDMSQYPKVFVAVVGSDEASKLLMTTLGQWNHIKPESWSVEGSRAKLFNAHKTLPPLGFAFQTDNGDLTFYYRSVFSMGPYFAVQAYAEAVKADSVKITTGLRLQKYQSDYGDNSDDFDSDLLYLLMAIFSSLTFPVIFSPIIYLYISERHTGTLHLYRLTRMSQLIYWIVAYLMDFLISFLWIVIIIILLFTSDIFTTACLFGYIVAVAAVSFALISQAYFLTFIFPNANTALAVLTIYNIVIALVLYAFTDIVGKSIRPMYDVITDALFPMKSLLQVILTMLRWCLSSSQLKHDAESNKHYPRPERMFQTCTKYELDVASPDEDPNLQYVYCSGWAVYSSAVFGCVYVGLLVLMTLYRGLTMKLNAKPIKYSTSNQDPDVTAEENKVEKTRHEDYAVSTKHLRKMYKNGVLAVQDLTLGVPKHECFGLLGVNGAGKSTTFHMLTGKLRPSAGIGFVGKVRIDGQAKFGFCPQFDVILQDLTVIETMNLFADLNGLQHGQECINLILDSLQMTHKKGNLVKKCSGGEKRRLSIAVALITNCDVIMLDEPTAGVDPRTRRHVWDILIAMRHVGTCEILSSHSMEECEALCTRIGFLNKGKLLGIGTSQHLKNKFGNNYMLTLTMVAADPKLASTLDDAVQKEFSGTPMASGFHATTLSWTVPKLQGARWSIIYQHLIQFVDRFRMPDGVPAIADFALIESSLEQVFIALSR